jgi:hypothetical protein
MKVKLRVIKGRDSSFNNKSGVRTAQYSLVCADPEETLLDNVDVVIPQDAVALVGHEAANFKGKVIEFTIEGIRDGFQRIQLTGTPQLK